MRRSPRPTTHPHPPTPRRQPTRRRPRAALKNRDSQLQRTLNDIEYDALLLLTGTPLQNDVSELFSLLNRIAPQRFPSAAAFAAEHGNLSTSGGGEALQRCANRHHADPQLLSHFTNF